MELWFHTYLTIVLEIFPPGKSPSCGRHVSQNTSVFARSIGNITDTQLTSFSQRLCVKLHGYGATIKES